MSDIERIVHIKLGVVSRLREYGGQEYPSWREPLKSLRIRYWYETLRQRAAVTTAYEMEQFFEPDSFVRNTDGSFEYYKNKWIHYEGGSHRPQATLKKVEGKFPGSSREFHHPLWSVLDLTDTRVMSGDTFLRQLTPVVQKALFKPSQDGILSNEVRISVTPSLLLKLEKQANLDVLACLVWLLREAAERQSTDAVAIGHTLHNVLIMMALEFEALKIGLPLLRFFIDHILPLGLPPYHRMWMIPSDYVLASCHLNLAVYGTSKGFQRTLTWSARVKIMQLLLSGRFGADIRYAMWPQFKPDERATEIPVEVLRSYERTRDLHVWGWECISSGKQGRLPPPELM